MSHDLRTPLAGLRALAEGLEDDVIEDRPAALRQMQQTVGRMSALVDDLFELSRLNAGLSQEQPARRPVSLVEVVHDVAGEARETARRRGVVLGVDVEAAGDRLAVQGNSDELARALSNLVGNAVRHTPAGGTVLVTARRAQDGRAQVSVTDGCGGIDDQDLDRVFDIGWRGQPERGTRRRGCGPGSDHRPGGGGVPRRQPHRGQRRRAAAASTSACRPGRPRRAAVRRPPREGKPLRANPARGAAARWRR